MNIRLLLAISLVLLCLTVWSGASSEMRPNTADHQPSAQALADLIRSDACARLEVLYFPTEMQTQAPLTPEQLEAHCWYRIGVREFQWSAVRTDLITALDVSSVETEAKEPDCRWGCIFYDREDSRVLTVYLDRRGSVGLINGTPVSGLSPLRRVLEDRCSPLWKGEVKYHPLAQ